MAKSPSDNLPESPGLLESKSAEFIFSPKKSAPLAALQLLSNSGGNIIQNLKFSGIEAEVIETRRSIPERTGLTPLAMATTGPGVLLVKMDKEKGRALARESAKGDNVLWIDENKRIYHASDILENYYSSSGLAYPANLASLSIEILGESDNPLVNTKVSLYTGVDLQPLVSNTDNKGIVSFPLPLSLSANIPAIVIEPAAMHWNKIIRTPNFQVGTRYRVRLKSFAESDPEFMTRGTLSWGVEQLKVAKNPALTGAGIKVGIIDTGCDSNHPLLHHVTRGSDYNLGATADSWRIDEVGHGTHCAGVIGARATKDMPFRGMAPECDIYVYKVFPRGDFFALGGAIEAAVADGVDIINMSLGSRDFSNDVVENINLARDNGIACFVAAGNSGDGVQFPANINSALAVSALGMIGYVPPDSIHANTMQSNFRMPDGIFLPNFTCFGTSVDFAGPGVGVISTVPNNGFKALDGTSMAAPHLAGLASLYLAHDPLLKAASRNAARVDMLFSRMKENVRNFPFGPDRIGAGLPIFSNHDT